MRFHAYWTLLALSVNAMPHAHPAAVPTVTLKGGQVIGTTSLPPGATAPAQQFLSIPFARSPPLRFAPPEPAPTWAEPLQATESPAACLQQFSGSGTRKNRSMTVFNNPLGIPPRESEDCLYVNVYSPPHAVAGADKPVMVWFYGGNLQFGASALDMYDGSSYAADQDVVVVVPNYRTNAFGFPGSPQLNAPYQNPGFLDQRFALQWVQDNIEAFGGSPKKVTIFGESAGGFSIKQLISLPPKPEPFRAAIIQSSGFLDSSIVPALSWERLASKLGCVGPDELSCVRSKDAFEIKNTIESEGLGFGPIEDGITFTRNSLLSAQSGSASKVPIIIGTNAQEATPFLWALGLQDDPTMTLQEVLNALIPNQKLLNLQLGALFYGNLVYQAATEIITNYYFQCTASAFANVQQARGVPVYRYRFEASFPNMDLFPAAGAWHSSEIPLVFGSFSRQNAFGAATEQQIGLSKTMQTAWAGFAKDPSSAPIPEWRPLDQAQNVFTFGNDESTTGEQTYAAKIDGLCPLLLPVIVAAGIQ